MLKSLLNKVIGDRTDRLVKRLAPVIDSVIEWADRYRELDDDDFPAKTEEFIYRIKRRECRIKEEFIKENSSGSVAEEDEGDTITADALSVFIKKRMRLREQFIAYHGRLIEAAAPHEALQRFRSRKGEIRRSLPAVTYRLDESPEASWEPLSGFIEWEIGKAEWRERYGRMVRSALGDGTEEVPPEALPVRSTLMPHASSGESGDTLKRRKARAIEELLRLHDALIGPGRECDELRDFRRLRSELRTAFIDARGGTLEEGSLQQLLEREADPSVRAEWLGRFYELLDRILPLLTDVDPACGELEARYGAVMEELIPDLSDVGVLARGRELWSEGGRREEFLSANYDLYIEESGLREPLLSILAVEREAARRREWFDRYGAAVRAFMARATESAPVREQWERQRKAVDGEDQDMAVRVGEYFIGTNAALLARYVPEDAIRDFLARKSAVKRDFIKENDHFIKLLDWEQNVLVHQYASILEELLPDIMRLESDPKLNERWKKAFNEVLDELLPEAYGLVLEACRRLKEQRRSWRVWDDTVTWDMVPFRVQIAGAIVLHRGTIAEMATGEGKTLVATMPLYLNALAKKGAYLVTVNDYLARRDAEWMGGVYRFLGVTVGFLQQGMEFRERKDAYECDITYGTNNEYGFDYLRDNMKMNTYFQVQRWRYFAIVDEVDSVLIDEARTPLIISDAVSKSRLAENYYLLRNDAKSLVQRQLSMIGRLLGEAKRGANGRDDPTLAEFVGDLEEEERNEEIRSLKMLIAQKGDPKNRDLAELRQEEGIEKDVLRWEEKLMVRAKNNIPCSLYDLEELLFFVIDERGNTVKVTQKGRENLSARVNSFAIPKLLNSVFTPEERSELQHLFILPNLSEKLDQMDNDRRRLEKQFTLPEQGARATLDDLNRLAEELAEETGARLAADKDALSSEDEEKLNRALEMLAAGAGGDGAERLTAAIQNLNVAVRDVFQRLGQEKKDELHRLYSDKNETIQNFYQLLKAYVLFSKDVDYIVKDGSVIIVDEFTGRLMPGRRYSDGLHQALEAKENVGVERETQTVATITLQNYFKMYSKLSGMTGTAATEEEEFLKVYDIDVNVIPTNKPVRRIDYDDVIYRTKDEKRKAIVEEVVRLHRKGLPVLIGTVSVHESERLSNMLKSYRGNGSGDGGDSSKKQKEKSGAKGGQGIPHNVLNAKHHKSEAQIIAEAGQPGAVTIATNMAGRGTDIKLGEGVLKCELCCIFCETPDECGSCPNPRKREDCENDVPCGLHVVGTERHESRRIDLQLRGRSGRQGDPGASRFFISLEDDLMRLIGMGSKRVLTVLDRLGAEKGEAIEHPMITRAISRAQKRMELFNFGIRKNLVEYDNVMNKQREAVYARRNEILLSSNPHEYLMKLVKEFIENTIDKHAGGEADIEEWELDEAAAELSAIFRISMVPTDAALPAGSPDRIVFEQLYARAQDTLEKRYGREVKRQADLTEELRDTARQYFLERAMDRFEERKKKLPLELWFNKRAFSQMSSIDLSLWSMRQKGQIPLSIIYDYEKFIMLKSIDDRWRDHLHEIDTLKEGIHLRSYAGKDVTVEFKKEAYELFMDMIEEVDSRILKSIFSPIKLDEGDAKKVEKIESMSAVHEEFDAFKPPSEQEEEAAVSVQKGGGRRGAAQAQRRAPKAQPVRTEQKVGRNDPCPCGSGKKYKKCCGRNAD